MATRMEIWNIRVLLKLPIETIVLDDGTHLKKVKYHVPSAPQKVVLFTICFKSDLNHSEI